MNAVVKDTVSAIGRLPGWAWGAAHTLIGSRFFVAVSGLFFVAFLAHVKNAPERFPPITKVSISAMLGFAPAVEAPPAAPDAVADQARQAVDAGIPYLQPYVDSARESVAAFFGTNADAVAFANLTGLVVSGLFFLLGLYLLARQETKMR